jgi:hypothetical protein
MNNRMDDSVKINPKKFAMIPAFPLTSLSTNAPKISAGTKRAKTL